MNIYEVLQRTLEADGGVGVDDAQLGDVHAPWEAEVVPTSCSLGGLGLDQSKPQFSW